MSRMSAEEYRRAMDALSRETTMPRESAARIERHLLDAFATRDAAAVVHSPRMKSFVWRPRSSGRPVTVSWRPWVPAAAAVVVAGVAFLAWAASRPQSSPPRGYVSAAPEAEKPPRVRVGLEANATAPSPAEVISHSPAPSRKPPKTNVVTPSGFVDLPWTAGLPAFESGEIVRMDIPVASLPTYGIDISSGAGKGPVEADVLIGQDGFARAIRLVTTSSRSTQ
jgi:hypothetical protein